MRFREYGVTSDLRHCQTGSSRDWHWTYSGSEMSTLHWLLNSCKMSNVLIWSLVVRLSWGWWACAGCAGLVCSGWGHYPSSQHHSRTREECCRWWKAILALDCSRERRFSDKKHHLTCRLQTHGNFTVCFDVHLPIAQRSNGAKIFLSYFPNIFWV